MGNKGLREGGCVFSAPKTLIIINQQENSRAREQGREEGDEKPAGAALGGVACGKRGSLRRLPADVF